jgi:hypothetical protein
MFGLWSKDEGGGRGKVGKMALLIESDVRARALRRRVLAKQSSNEILSEVRADAAGGYDIFLSHSSNEPEEILLGIKSILEDDGLSVYVDRYGDPDLAPDKVTQQTAEVLRRRMRQSNALLYAYSQHSTKSRWMPWELGYFDGLKGKVGIIPVMQATDEIFRGEEYLGLYPYVDKARVETARPNSSMDQ